MTRAFARRVLRAFRMGDTYDTTPGTLCVGRDGNYAAVDVDLDELYVCRLDSSRERTQIYRVAPRGNGFRLEHVETRVRSAADAEDGVW